MTDGFIINNCANNLYVLFLLTMYKSFSDTKMDTEEKFRKRIEKKINFGRKMLKRNLKKNFRKKTWEEKFWNKNIHEKNL